MSNYPHSFVFIAKASRETVSELQLQTAKKNTHVLFPMTLLMFICTVSCFRLMANTTRVSHGAPC